MKSKFSPALIRGSVSILLGLLVWEVAFHLTSENELIVAPPSSVYRAFIHMLLSEDLLSHIEVTLIEFVSGFSCALVVGIILGYLMGSYKVVDDVLDPWFAALYAIPVIAFVPIIIIWFGLGIVSKIIVVFKITILAVALNTAAGIKSVDRTLLEVAASFKLTSAATIFKVKIPAALPFILTGIRLGVGRALLGVVIAEIVGASAGLGYLLREYGETFDTANLFVSVLILAAMGVGSFLLIKKVEEWLAPWRKTAMW